MKNFKVLQIGMSAERQLRNAAFAANLERDDPNPFPAPSGFGTGRCECCAKPISRNKSVCMLCLKVAAGKLTADTMRAAKGKMVGKEVYNLHLADLEGQNHA
jgi:hypothetical protein